MLQEKLDAVRKLSELEVMIKTFEKLLWLFSFIITVVVLFFPYLTIEMYFFLFVEITK